MSEPMTHGDFFVLTIAPMVLWFVWKVAAWSLSHPGSDRR